MTYSNPSLLKKLFRIIIFVPACMEFYFRYYHLHDEGSKAIFYCKTGVLPVDVRIFGIQLLIGRFK